MDAKRLIRLCIYSTIALTVTATISPDLPAEASLPPPGESPGRLEQAIDQPSPSPPREIGMASWYGPDRQGRRTASGARFDWRKLTAAHRTLPLDSQVKITNLANDSSYQGTNLLNSTDAALGSVTADLQRARELAVQAANGTLSPADKGAIQLEVTQLQQSVLDQVIEPCGQRGSGDPENAVKLLELRHAAQSKP